MKSPKGIILVIFLVAVLAAFFDAPAIWDKGINWINGYVGAEILPQSYNRPFKLGLDLQGGTHLVYEADLAGLLEKDKSASMQGVKDVIERRVNLFGVAEPVVQVNKVGESYRLIVELAGVKDAFQAIRMIGQTPALDFRVERPQKEAEEILNRQTEIKEKIEKGEGLSLEEESILIKDPLFEQTPLTGRFLEGSQLQFDQTTGQAQVGLDFDDEGGKIFEELTRENIGKRIAIYLDGVPISVPVVQEAISGGKAQITGSFNLAEAKELAQRLNAGALPVPINLISQQTIGASLGKISLDKSLQAAVWGFVAVLLFMIFYYRLPGLMAGLSLVIYIVLVLAILKLIPVTLTLAGIAGFILSVGMAVDANVLIFERFKEEFKSGKSLGGSIDEGFSRAWPAIRDGNTSTLITSLILYIFATGLVRGFALTLGIGVLVSMFSAIFVTKNFLRFFVGKKIEGIKKIWY
ncbi:MAG: protein translocase subunit SecD [Candidatus Portnoybacteria bacterium]